jgi:trehalose 6-phosphate synthase
MRTTSSGNVAWIATDPSAPAGATGPTIDLRNGPASMPAIESPIVVASNRGPVSFERDQQGEVQATRGAGGLVTALSGVFHRDDITWLSAGMNDTERELATDGGELTPEGGQRMCFVSIPPERYDTYYNRIANRILWFVHHYLWDAARSPSFDDATRADWGEFVEANRAFAVALAEQGDEDPVYLIQDYQLSLVPEMLRRLRPEARIVHFSHTPFVGPTYLRILPVEMRSELLRGLAGADVIGFQARAWAENYLMSARSLPGVRADVRKFRLDVEGRRCLVRAFPVAVDAHSLRETAAGAEAKTARREVNRLRGDGALLLRVDRLEPTKNILRGFQAFALFLKEAPAWRERVRFLALLSPSRDDVPEYRSYRDEVLSTVDAINGEFGTDAWQPIDVRIQEDYAFAIGAYAVYDALLVNPVFDGMNLVAMEGPIANRRKGALILSRNAGAFGRLGRHALGVNPFDLEETAEAIRTALEMDVEERTRRARGLSRTVQAHTPAAWVADQLKAVDQVRPPA